MRKKKEKTIVISKPLVRETRKASKTRWVAAVAWLALLFMPSILAKDVPSYEQQNKNIEIIRELTKNDVETYYRNMYTNNGDLYLMKNVPAKKYLAFWEKEIKLNMFFDINKETKTLLEETIDLFNIINQKTYTNFPKITFDYEPSTLEQANLFKINVFSRATLPWIPGKAIYSAFLTTKGSGIVCSEIVMSNEITDKPELFCSVFMHELMHVLYGFDEAYKYSNSNETIMSTADKGRFLSLNDIYLIDSASWTREPTDEQKKNIKKFYADYEKLYNSCDGHIISKLYENIQKDIDLEN